MGRKQLNPYLDIRNNDINMINQYLAFGNDPDAITYLNAIGIANDTTVYYSGTAQEITGAGIWSAVNKFFIDQKAAGLWTTKKIVYLMIGGTSSRHRINAVLPSSHLCTFNGTFLHDALGAKGNGASLSYISTDFSGGIFSGINSKHIAFYSQTNQERAECDFANLSGDQLWIRGANTSMYHSCSCAQQGPNTVNFGSTTGLFDISRIASTDYSVYRNGVSKYTKTINSASFTSANFLLGAYLTNNSNSSKEYCYFEFTDGYTSTQIANNYNIVQQLQTDLKRALS
jgi:hypothetical protein